MRKNLKKIDGERTGFTATVGRFGTKKNYHGFPQPTILFTGVKFVESGKYACGHIWFTVGKRIESLDLKEGERVSFEARVGSYVKGYVNHHEYIDERELDFKLNNPTKIKRVDDNL